MKDTLATILVLVAVFCAGWFVNGKRVDHDWRQRIDNAPFVLQSFERYIDVPVPGKPVPIPGKPVKDTTGIAAAVDSMVTIYKDSLTVMKELARKFSGEHKDSNIYLRATADPVRRMITIDSLYIAPVRCDSIVATKVVIDPPKATPAVRTVAAVTIGAAAGAEIGGTPGAAIGSLAGLVFDWIF